MGPTREPDTLDATPVAEGRKSITGGFLINTLAMYVVHIAGYVLPLVLVPFLARTLGPEGWGTYALVIAVSSLGGIVIDMGVGQHASRLIALEAEASEVRNVVFDALGAKQLTSVLALLLGGIVLVMAPVLGAHIIVAATVLALGQANSMLWYYQGRNRLRIHARNELVGRVCSLIAVITFVKGPEDAYVAALLYASGYYISMAMGVFEVMGAFGLPLRPRVYPALAIINDARPLLVTRVGIAGYNSGIPLILGIVSGPNVLGTFSLAERVVRAAAQAVAPLVQVLFPIAVQMQDGDRDRRLLVRRAGITIVVLWICGAGLLAALAPSVIRLLGGNSYPNAVNILRILCFIPPLVALNSVLSSLVIIARGEYAVFRGAVTIACLVGVLIAAASVFTMGAVGAAIGLVLAEVALSAMLWWHVRTGNGRV